MVKQTLRGLALAAVVASVLIVAPGSEARISRDMAIRSALRASVPGFDQDSLAAAGGTAAAPAWTQTSPGSFAWSIFGVNAAGLTAGPFAYGFDSARVGNTSIPTQPAVLPSLDAAGAAVFDRGALRERYVLMAGGVEQLFDIDSLPGAGDLVIRGLVSGAAFEASQSNATVLTYGPITVSNAVAIDSNGSTLALAMAHSNGGLEITVPAAWLAAAAFPVTIDPFIGASAPLDTPPVSTNAPFRGCDVAYSTTSNEYFVVWAHQPLVLAAGAAGDMDIFGRRIDAATGLPIGGVINVETGTTSDAIEPAITWNSANNTYCVVFADRDLPPTALHIIRGRILTSTGAASGGKFTVTTLGTGFQELWPDVAFDGTNYLVTWGRNTAGGTFNVHGQRLSATGTAVGTILDLETGTNDARRTCVAFLAGTANTYIAGWSEATTTTALGSIRARTVSTAGVLGTANVISTGATQDHDWPRIAANPTSNECLMVYDSGPNRNVNPYGTPSPDLNFRRVSASAVGIGTQTPIVTATTGASLGDVAWSSVDNEYVIVWATGSAAIDTTITLARVDGGTDTILENNTLVSATAGQDEYIPSIGARTGTTDVLIAWARVNPTTPLNVSWHYRRYQTSVPVVPPGGGGSAGRDNPNGNQLFNDTLCGGGAAAAAGTLGLALGLATLLLVAARR